MRLVNKDTGEVVAIGDNVNSFRGEEAIVTGGSPPHKEGSTGRVDVRWTGMEASGSYFPSVFNLEWRDERHISDADLGSHYAFDPRQERA